MAIILGAGRQARGAVERVLQTSSGDPVNKQLSGTIFSSDNSLVATIAPDPTDSNPNAFVIVAVNPGITLVRATDGVSVVGVEVVQVLSPGAYAPKFNVTKTESKQGI